MNIIIVGCGRVGQTLAENLNNDGNDVTVVDLSPVKVKDVTDRVDVMGVIGNGEYALHETKELLNVVGSVTVYTNGEKPLVEFPDGVVLKTEKIKNISGKPITLEINFEDSTDIVNGVFVAYKTAGSTALAKKVGATIDGNKISVSDKMQTNIKGLFAAGDCTGGLLQISKAVYEGAQAATEIIKYVKESKKQYKHK